MFTIYKSPQGPEPLVPDVLIDFADGYGIPVANGGIGGPGSNLVQITSPQDGASGARLVRAPRYWDLQAEWRQGEPIFVPKQAGRLVGWPGPRAGGYWTGPMPARASTSETVVVYASYPPQLIVTPVAGGVVGPDAIRVTVAAGAGGSGGWVAWPYPVHDVAQDVGGTCFYAHAVVEAFGDVTRWRPRFILRDQTGGVEMRSLEQPLLGPDTAESGVVQRGVGPHGGQLFEVWAAMKALSLPPQYLGGLVYLVHAPGNTEPMDLIVHGLQSYFLVGWRHWPLIGLPPFFSYARGASVVWTPERLSITHTQLATTIGMRVDSNQMPAGEFQYNVMASFDGSWARNSVYETSDNELAIVAPLVTLAVQRPKTVVWRLTDSRQRAVTVDGTTVQAISDHAELPLPTTIDLGAWTGDSYGTGRFRRVLIWRRALSDTEMRQAWRAL